VQHGHSTGLILAKADAEEVGEQVVVAPPPAGGIQRHQEQVGPFHLLQHLLAVGAAGDRVTQLAAQPVQHGGVQ
jgi:hypothetical protein